MNLSKSKKILLVVSIILTASLVGFFSVKQSVSQKPQEKVQIEAGTNNSKRPVVSKAKIEKKPSSSVRKKATVFQSEIQKIASSELSQYEKLKLLKEYIAGSDMQLEDFLEELRDLSGSMNKEFVEQLFYLGVRDNAKKYPLEIYNKIKDRSLESMGIDSFISDEHGNLFFENIYTGLLESGEASLVQDLKKNDLWLLDISKVIVNMGKHKAADWALKNKAMLSSEEFQKIVNLKADDFKDLGVDKTSVNINYALSWAQGFEPGSIESAYALSNIAIQQAQYQNKHHQEIDWLTDFEPGFTRDRVTLGYALGTSRFYKDKELEKNIKSMFVKDDFNAEEARIYIQNSNLPEDVKNSLMQMQ